MYRLENWHTRFFVRRWSEVSTTKGRHKRRTVMADLKTLNFMTYLLSQGMFCEWYGQLSLKLCLQNDFWFFHVFKFFGSSDACEIILNENETLILEDLTKQKIYFKLFKVYLNPKNDFCDQDASINPTTVRKQTKFSVQKTFKLVFQTTRVVIVKGNFEGPWDSLLRDKTWNSLWKLQFWQQ